MRGALAGRWEAGQKMSREGRRNLKQTGDATAPPFFFLRTNPTSSCCFLFLLHFQSGVPRSLPSCPPFIFLRSSRASSYCKSLFSPAATARCKNPDIAFSTLNRKSCVPRLFAHFYTPTSIAVPGKEILCVIWVCRCAPRTPRVQGAMHREVAAPQIPACSAMAAEEKGRE